MGVTKLFSSGSVLESSTVEGDSPVRVGEGSPAEFLSRAGHVKSGLKLP